MELLESPGLDIQDASSLPPLDYLREEYYEEFRGILLKKARKDVEDGDPHLVVAWANATLEKLSRWAFDRHRRIP